MTRVSTVVARLACGPIVVASVGQRRAEQVVARAILRRVDGQVAGAVVSVAAISIANDTVDAGYEGSTTGTRARLMPRMLMLVGALIVGLFKVVHHLAYLLIIIFCLLLISYSDSPILSLMGREIESVGSN